MQRDRPDGLSVHRVRRAVTIRLIEFFGGPFDGMKVPVPAGTETIVIRSSDSTVCTYQIDEIHEGPRVRLVFRLTRGGAMIAAIKPPMRWIKATPEERWAVGGVYWVTIRCIEDGSLGVGLFAGGPDDSVAMTSGIDVTDGRDYVVTHYCQAQVEWPEPAE